MIFLNGVPFHTHDHISSSSSNENDTLLALMNHPTLVSASESIKAIPERKFKIPEESCPGRLEKSKWVYLFQREYATADPALVDFIGTDEATTCVGFAIRNRKNGITSVAHMDSPNIVDKGLDQMLSSFIDRCLDDDLDVHMIGSFEDSSPDHGSDKSGSESDENLDGHSFSLCSKIIETLMMKEEKFHFQTLCVLAHNTKKDSEGNACPIFNGLVIEMSTGSVIPASFDTTSRCPDEIVRRIRVTSSYEHHKWDGKLLETYNTLTDRFEIAPCRWTWRQERIARRLRDLSDSEVLHLCSTSPSAEAPDFVANERRKWEYLIQHPNWNETFPMEQPRVFKRTADGDWRRC